MNTFNFFLKFFVFLRSIIVTASKFFFSRISLHKRHLLRGVIIGIIISVVVTSLAWLGHLKPYENVITDTLQSITVKKANNVSLLFITATDYQEEFNGISPLSREKLADIINVLVNLGAKVIALDIDISERDTKKQKLSDSEFKLYSAIENASKVNVPVVVAAAYENIPDQFFNESAGNTYPYSEENVVSKDSYLVFDSVTPGTPWGNNLMYGLVNFRLDQDGIFRQSEAAYKINNHNVTGNDKVTYAPSLPIAIAGAYWGLSQENLEKLLAGSSENKITFQIKNKSSQNYVEIHTRRGGIITPNFIGNYRHFIWSTFSTILNEYGDEDLGVITPFKDKIVIIGGAYNKKDIYFTPVGKMTGLEIIANITQNIISSNLISHTNFRKAFIIEVILAIMVSLVYILTSRIWATIICFITFIPLVAAASLLSFKSSYYWFDFIPTVSGVMIHGLISKVESEIKPKIKSIINKREENNLTK